MKKNVLESLILSGRKNIKNEEGIGVKSGKLT